MKILFVSQYFYPEVFRGNDICFDLASKGEDVTVITGIPNYPQGCFYKGYGLFKKRKEKINGVTVIRIPIFPRGKSNAMGLLLNYFSYAIIASLYTMYWAFFRKFDLVIVQQLSPVLISVPGVIYKKIRKVPLYTWVLDLWPESLTSAGGVKNSYVLGFFDWFAKWEYKHSTKILISSNSFRKSIVSKGRYAEKLIYFPNWAEDVFVEKNNNYVIPEMPDGFKIMFAGNVGEAQDFDHIMKAALLLKEEKNLKFIIIGDGRKKKWVDDFVIKNELQNTVFVLGRYPLAAMPLFFRKADVMLVTLKDELVFNLTAPAKLQAYMSSKKPIIGMINGEGAGLIHQANCGCCVNAGDSKELADVIKMMASLPISKLNEFGQNGYDFCETHFDKKNCMNNLYSILNS